MRAIHNGLFGWFGGDTATLGIHYVLMSLSSFRLPGVPLETWLYQATLPGLVEETVFRGVLLALAERAVAARHACWNVMGARIGCCLLYTSRCV